MTFRTNPAQVVAYFREADVRWKHGKYFESIRRDEISRRSEVKSHDQILRYYSTMHPLFPVVDRMSEHLKTLSNSFGGSTTAC
jgi:hypothetical protein